MSDKEKEKDTRTDRQKYLDNYRATHTHAEYMMELDCLAGAVFPDEKKKMESAVNSFAFKENEDGDDKPF